MAPPESAGRGRPSRPRRRARRPRRPARRGRAVPRDRRAARAPRRAREPRSARPDLWDDPDRARAVTTELGRVSDDAGPLRRAGRRASTTPRCSRARRRGRAAAASPTRACRWSWRRSLSSLERQVGRLELQSLFSGEYDDRDAIAEVHAGAGGTDAQDWAEMLLRMYQRWAERRGFAVEVDEATEGQEAGLLSATFIVRGRFAYGLLGHRARRAPARAHVALRLPAPPPDELRLARRRPRSSRTSPTRSTSTRRTCASTPTARRAPAASTSTRPTRRCASPTCRPASSSRCQNERSQHQNKATAMQILAAKLAERSAPGAPGRARLAVGRADRQRVGQPDPLLRARALPAGEGPPHRTSRRATSRRCSTATSTTFIEAELRRRRRAGRARRCPGTAPA